VAGASVAKDDDPYLAIHVPVFCTWTLGEESLKSQSWPRGFLCSCSDCTLTYFDLRAGQAWRAAPETGKLKTPQQL